MCGKFKSGGLTGAVVVETDTLVSLCITEQAQSVQTAAFQLRFLSTLVGAWQFVFV